MSVKKEGEEEVKKAVAKKVPAKKVAELKDGDFKVTKVGANVAVTVVGSPKERYARKVTLEEYDKIAKKVLLYNKKPTPQLRDQIIKLAAPETTKAKAAEENVKIKAKAVKKQIKKEEKQTNEVKKPANIYEEVEAAIVSKEVTVADMEALLAKFKAKEEVKAAPVVTPTPRGGESYRRY